MRQKVFQIILIAIISAITAAHFAAQQKSIEGKQIEVKIYLQKTLIDPSGASSDKLAFVKRRVDAASPLHSTLGILFSPNITVEEEAQHFHLSTFRMKFEGVNLKNGTATVRFSQPPGESTYGSAGPMILAEAIEKTARQFPTVKRVKICAVGDTMIDSELEKPFPRCEKN